MHQQFDLAIGGMTCGSCVARVEKLLGRVEGVRRVSVNLATETAHCEGNAVTRFEDLVAAVGRAGYSASPAAQAKPRTGRRELTKLIAAALLSAPLFMDMALPLPGWVQLALATPVQFWLGARFYVAGFKAVRAGAGNMDLLVALGTTAAFALSVFDFATHGPLYFESSAAVITLIRLGKYLERRAKREAATAITGLARLRPELAHLRGQGNVSVTRLAPGDEIELRPGERVPVDGVISCGRGSLDESAITGESLPVSRGPGEMVLAGTLNLNAALVVRVTACAGESFLDRMARLIEAAQNSKPQVQKLADRVASVFVPVVVVFALATFAGWALADAHLSAATIHAVSVLVIACPCALGLATPAAILAGTGAAARQGILLRNADVIEAAAKADVVVFDKTGTLTIGTPRLEEVVLHGDATREDVLAIAAALAASDTHPLSKALRQENVVAAEAFHAFPGRGVEGRLNGTRYVLGSAAFVGDVPVMRGGTTWSHLATGDGRLLAGFAFTDTPRPEAKAAIERLCAIGCEVMLLSGDREAAAQALGHALGITRIVAEASPDRKLAVIRAEQAAGRVVAMVGDGVNDAAALAAADVGMAIGSGADVAIEAADISLLRPDIMLVTDAISLSRKTWAVLRQGLFWAMIYNIVGLPVAAFGMLSPTLAGVAMAASSLCVVANALRLRR